MEDKELAKKATESEAREVAEAAREKEWTRPSFLRELFMGRFDISLIHPHPEQDPEEEARAREFLDKLAEFLRARVDSEAIDREGRISEEIVEELRRMGAFGIKIPREYGGLGFSQLTYNRAMALVGSKDGSLGALLSAHQSIGVPQPLKLFGHHLLDVWHGSITWQAIALGCIQHVLRNNPQLAIVQLKNRVRKDLHSAVNYVTGVFYSFANVAYDEDKPDFILYSLVLKLGVDSLS